MPAHRATAAHRLSPITWALIRALDGRAADIPSVDRLVSTPPSVDNCLASPAPGDGYGVLARSTPAAFRVAER